MNAMEYVVVLAAAGRLFVETAVFIKAVWTTMSAVLGMDTSAIPALLAWLLVGSAVPDIHAEKLVSASRIVKKENIWLKLIKPYSSRIDF